MQSAPMLVIECILAQCDDAPYHAAVCVAWNKAWHQCEVAWCEKRRIVLGPTWVAQRTWPLTYIHGYEYHWENHILVINWWRKSLLECCYRVRREHVWVSWPQQNVIKRIDRNYCTVKDKKRGLWLEYFQWWEKSAPATLYDFRWRHQSFWGGKRWLVYEQQKPLLKFGRWGDIYMRQPKEKHKPAKPWVFVCHAWGDAQPPFDRLPEWLVDAERHELALKLFVTVAR